MNYTEYNILEILDKIIDYRGRTPHGSESGIPTLSARSVKMGYIDYSSCYYISEEEYTKFMVRGLPKEGDILITTEAPLGNVAKLDRNDIALAQRLLAIRPNPNIADKDYLLYFFLSEMGQALLRQKQSGSTVMGIRQEEFRKINIILPPLSDQKKIAHVLSSLDRKIALNRAINRNLEAMAKQLYDYWFVQFDFPNDEGKPYKSSGGKMVWNESLKREIPEGWEVTRLDEMTSSVNGGEWGDDAYSDKSPIEIHCLRGADFKDTYEAPTRYISPKKQGKCLTEFDLVVEISGGSPTQATGRSVFITKELLDYYDDKLTCTNFCQSVSFGNKQIALYFNYIWNMFYENDIMFNFEGKTSGLKNLQIDVILKEQWYIPTDNLLENFHDKVLPMLQAMEENKKQNKSLAAQRDSLLPLLMNGQVTIK